MSRAEGGYLPGAVFIKRGGIYLERLGNQYISEVCHENHSITNADNCSINLLLQFGEETKPRMNDFKGK